MTGPMMSVLIIGGTVVAALLFFFLLLKTVALHDAFNRTFGWVFVAGLVVVGLVGSVAIWRYGLGSPMSLPFLLALTLFNLADAPRQNWARAVLWLTGLLLSAVILWRWPNLRTFADDGLWTKVFTGLITGLFFYMAGHSLYRMLRPSAATPSSTPSAETGTPA